MLKITVLFTLIDLKACEFSMEFTGTSFPNIFEQILTLARNNDLFNWKITTQLTP